MGRKVLPPDDRRHGMHNGYTNHGCRCGPCKDARAAYRAAKKAVGLPEGSELHGTHTGYATYGCRCQPCKDARAAYRAAKKAVGLPEGSDLHGTYNGYTNYGCRCGPCKDAKAAYTAAKAAAGIPDRDPRHGTPAGYAAGCRCGRCSEAKSEAYRVWRQDNLGLGRDKSRRRRAHKLNARVGPAWSETEILANHGTVCIYCGDPWEHLDHVIPLAGGGYDAAPNMRPACATCNTSKGATHPYNWAQIPDGRAAQVGFTPSAAAALVAKVEADMVPLLAAHAEAELNGGTASETSQV